MKKPIIVLSLITVMLSLVAVGAFTLRGGQHAAHAAAYKPSFSFSCSRTVSLGSARCDAIITNNQGLHANFSYRATVSGPSGYHPADLQAAYKLTSLASTNGTGQTIAIVDAYDDPNAEADLAVYRSTFGLPACTTINGCFKKVNQTGGTTYPSADAGWAQEISLDVDMVSAICPNCHILLVEATSPIFQNLGTAVNEAVKLGANAVSNSYGGYEYFGENTLISKYYTHPGVAITASSGDSGYGPQIPAAFNTLTAVGGTSLKTATNSRGWNETVWRGAGSGCSIYISKPNWQTDSGCSRRTIADVSAVADPNTGVSVYDSYPSGGWLVFGGTSVSSPIIASVYGLAGNANSFTVPASNAYSHRGSLYDVTSGSNGNCGRSNTYLCTGKSGYDGPSGLGTPMGIGAF